MKAMYVTDRAAAGDERFFRILDALAGAPLSVELREKAGSDREVCALAADARRRLGPSVPLSVNGRFDVALAAGADGVHLPADGLPVARVRAVTPRGFRVGVSTHSAAEAIAAIDAGADVVVIGPVFDTPSKRAFGAPLGPEVLAALPGAREHSAEVFAIGGVDEARLPELDAYRDRIAGIAAVRLFQDAADPRAIVERIASR